MQKNKKALLPVFFPGLVVVICLLAKWAHAGSTHSDLLFVLAPVNFLVSIFTGSPSVFDSEIGYHHPSLHMIIDKSCAGINFMIICFGSLFSLLYREQAPAFTNFKKLLLSVLLAYALTLLANTSRIVVLITSLRFSMAHSWIATDWFHQAMGAFIYLAALLSACLIVHKTLQKVTNSHAQSPQS